jgi:hypothetical protein
MESQIALDAVELALPGNHLEVGLHHSQLPVVTALQAI